jgi:cell migration-inducing and hyaluronan-binding protein
MSRKNRSFLYVALLPALLLGSVIAVVQAQSAGSTKLMNWSNPATWPDRKVPAAGDKVEIASGKEVLLDVSPPALGGVTVNGKLTFADKSDVELTTEWVMVHGELQIGTEAKPYTHKATITLTDNVKDEQMMGMGDRGIMLSGGTLNLHGNRTNAWTRLSKTAEAGSNSIEVLNAAQWKVGDEIVLASTDYDARQAERRTIAAISGNKITLDKKLEFMHFGEITFNVDERGEVGLLTRNIKIQASADADESFFGGHIMAMVTSRMFVEGVELNRMGQNLELARYPIHWHLVGDEGKGQYIRNAAIHDTYNRCVTVHGTNYLQVENNVTYNNVGHCFFLEDGIEHGNQFVHNLAIQTKCHVSKPCDPTDLAPFGSTADLLNFKTTGQDAKDILIPSDNTASSYWITNPDNTFVGNVAAGSDATGFWFAFPDHPTGAFEGSDASKNTWPAQTKLREFRGNVSHSNFDSLMQDRAPTANGHIRAWGFIAFANPAVRTDPVVSAVEDFTAYKNRNSGIWGRGEMHLYKGLRFADNGIGFTHAGGNFDRSFYPFTSRVVDSVFVGESGNVGNPRAPSEIAYGRSLPQPKVPDFPIRAYEFYDYHHELDNNTFVNYEDNATRKTGAISELLFSSFAMSTTNTLTRSTFIKAKPVYFPPMENNNRWSNDDWGNTSYGNTVFYDKDGTITGVPDSYVINTLSGVDLIDNCEVRPTWNAAVCTGDIGRMNIGGGGLTSYSRAAALATAPGGGRIRGTPAPAGPTLVTRNGKEVVANGETNVRAGSEFTVKTEDKSVNIRVRELEAGSWVMFKLPGFAKAAAGAEQNSLDALRNASKTSWFKANDALWVKLVSTGYKRGSNPGAIDSLQVSR